MDWLKDLLKKATSVVSAPITFAQQKLQDWAMTHPQQAENIIKLEPTIQKFKPIGKFFEGFGEGYTGGLVDIPLEKSKSWTERIPYATGYLGGTLTGLPSKIAQVISPVFKPVAEPLIKTGLKMATGQGLKAAAGRGLINLAEGLPYTASFTGLGKVKEALEGKPPSLKETPKELLSSSLTDIGLAALPFGSIFLSTKPVTKQIKNVDELASVISKEYKVKAGEGLTKSVQEVLGDLINKGYRFSKDLGKQLKEEGVKIGKNFVLSIEKPMGVGKPIANFIFEEGYKPIKEVVEKVKPKTGVRLKVKTEVKPQVSPAKVLPTETRTIIPKELEPLAEEARKYKSAEEFYKALGEVAELRAKYPKQFKKWSDVEDWVKTLPESKQQIARLNYEPKIQTAFQKYINREYWTKEDLINFYNQAVKKAKVKPPTPLLSPTEELGGRGEVELRQEEALKGVPQPPSEGLPLLPGEVKPLTPKQAVSIYKKTGEAHPFVNVLKEGEEPIKLTDKAEQLAKTFERKGEMFDISDIEEIGKDASKLDFFSQARRVIDKLGTKTKEFLVDFHAEQMAGARRFVDEEIRKVVDVLNKEGIKKGKEEEKILFRLADGQISEDEVISLVGQQKAESIFRARDAIRNYYDNLLNKINEVRRSLNLEEVPRREDYITHLFELTEKSKQAINSDLYLSKIIGEKPFFRFGQKRTEAKGYKEDIYDAIHKYGLASVYQIAIPPVINRYKLVIDALSQSGNYPNITNYLSRLAKYIQSGIEPSLAAEYEYPLKKDILKTIDTVATRVSKNLVSGNISAALSNPTQILTTLPAEIGWDNVLAGIGKTFTNLFKMTPEEIDSVFLTNRKDIFDPTKGFVAKAFEKVDVFSILTRLADRMAFNSYLSYALKQGMSLEEALKFADDKAPRLVGERVYGLVPEYIRGGGFSKLFTMFTLEPVNAIYTTLKDIPEFSKNAKDLAIKLGLFLIYAHTFNDLMEKAIGRRFAFDPVEIVTKTLDIWLNKPYDTDEKIQETIRVLTKNLPLLDVAFGKGGVSYLQTPIFAPVPSLEEVKYRPWRAVARPLLLLANPYGYGYQAYKTLTGLESYLKGGVETPKGELKYPVERNLETFLRMTLFGESAVPQARRYYEEKRKPLSLDQTLMIKQLPEEDKIKAWEALMFYRGVKGELQTLKQKISDAVKQGKSEEEVRQIAQDQFSKAKKNIAYYTSEFKQPKTAGERVIDFFKKIMGVHTQTEIANAKKEKKYIPIDKEKIVDIKGGIDLSTIGGGGGGGGGITLKAKSIPKLNLLKKGASIKIKSEKVKPSKTPSYKLVPLKVSTRHKQIAEEAEKGVRLKIKKRKGVKV